MVSRDGHLAAEGIDLTRDVSLGRAADAAVAGQVPDPVEPQRDTQCSATQARASEGRFDSCLPGTHHDHFELAQGQKFTLQLIAEPGLQWGVSGRITHAVVLLLVLVLECAALWPLGRNVTPRRINQLAGPSRQGTAASSYSARAQEAARKGDQAALESAYRDWVNYEESQPDRNERRILQLKGRLGVLLADGGQAAEAAPLLADAVVWRRNRGGPFAQDWAVTYWLYKTGSPDQKQLALAQVGGEIDLGYGTMTTVEELESQGISKLEVLTYMAGMVSSGSRFRGETVDPARGYAMMSSVVDAHPEHGLLNYGACLVLEDEALVRRYASRAYERGGSAIRQALLGSFGPRKAAAEAARGR